MFYTGKSRRAGDILEKQRAVTNEKMDVLTRMKDLGLQALDVLREGRSLNRFGEILHEGWLLKRSLVDDISTEFINTCYESARRAGAIGGKLLGAGGGGFLLFYVEKQNQDRVRQALADLQELPFRFEPQGSKIIYISDDL
jgi:D-glycero-alpha-D-manno-heptose-7-phosphate kinase